MHVLIAASTINEIHQIAAFINDHKGIINGNSVSLLTTGVGGVSTTYSLLDCLNRMPVDLLIQAGVAGSYDAGLEQGETVLVKEDLFADLGALKGKSFEDIFDLKLEDQNKHPFTNRLLVNPYTDRFGDLGLRLVRGATVNEISASSQRTNLIIAKYSPETESMEGAAFHYVCLMKNLPFLQLRSISNMAGERDKSKWTLKKAIDNLNEKLYRVILNLKN